MVEQIRVASESGSYPPPLISGKPEVHVDVDRIG
ncbi:hypothetical protein SAMN05216278_3264 [Halopelagius longus]|uniref:Uncharacterized protein n=1 Tax=Halopelagius longus TaxID=1236180 RepID=A0A1H1FKT2_9EURY|nr:hypothetical protein SAMN05216278_3264 [Halopelagius longus]